MSDYTVHDIPPVRHSVDPIDDIGNLADIQYYGDHHSLSILTRVTIRTVNHLGIGVTVPGNQPCDQFFPWTSVVRLILT